MLRLSQYDEQESILDRVKVDDHFTKIGYTQHTRNKKYLMKIPKLRTEFAKKSAQAMAAKMNNDLPIETRKESSFSPVSDKPNTLFEHKILSSFSSDLQLKLFTVCCIIYYVHSEFLFFNFKQLRAVFFNLFGGAEPQRCIAGAQRTPVHISANES